jgi:hypothetical protein
MKYATDLLVDEVEDLVHCSSLADPFEDSPEVPKAAMPRFELSRTKIPGRPSASSRHASRVDVCDGLIP